MTIKPVTYPILKVIKIFLSYFINYKDRMFKQLIKPANAVLAGYSYIASIILGRASMMGMPVAVSAELTNCCNLKCAGCFSGSGLMNRERGYMNIELFTRVIDELRPFLFGLNLYFQGEPMMHPEFFSFLKCSSGINTVVSTNGHFLSDENSEALVRSGLGKLIISLDGTDQDTYAAYRVNGNAGKVINGINSIAEAKKKWRSAINIEIQFLVNRINEHQVTAVRDLVKKAGLSLRLKSMQVIHKEDAGSWLPSSGKFRRYKMKDGKWVLKGSLPDRCARLWFNPVFTWDGKVVPCCFDKNAEYVMGDLNNDSFRTIWEGRKYSNFRDNILKNRKMTDICCNCTSGLRGAAY